MSIICKSVEEEICKRAAFPDVRKFVRATIDPKTRHELNFPTDYQFHEVFLPEKYAEFADHYQNFEIRSDDIWICGYEKTGTVWMQNIVRKLTQNLNFDIPLVRTPHEFFEIESIFDVTNNPKMEEVDKTTKSDQLKRMHQMQSRRIFKTHLPPFLMPKEIWTKKAKVIYMTRNPKDATISKNHMYNSRYGLELPPEYSFQLMVKGETMFTPFPEHVLSFWQLRKLDNVLFLAYEELSADRFAGCKKVSEFLGYNYGDDKLQELADLVEFNNMKKRLIDPSRYTKESNYSHCRKGQVGGYRNEMSQEWVDRFDQWIADGFKNTDFDYSKWL